VVDPSGRVIYMSAKAAGSRTMRAETERTIAEIEQVVSLLRRHL
jgi:hypothetical protein